ncbi:MAG: hypothetical protein FJY85_02400 [Deltaproteobacteria bacterium]|nr:hypothetical protein [Deltaproteobacteria bacterium]MBM4445440.1 hypothetical protein [Chloroflexota bacterium]
MVLMRLLGCYPAIFPFNILDYNTTKGIDFVVERQASPKYIELKGTFRRKVNHSFRHIDRFVCYELELNDGEVIEDVEELKTSLQVKKDNIFESPDKRFHGKKYTTYQLIPQSPVVKSMEILVLKGFLSEVVGATFE